MYQFTRNHNSRKHKNKLKTKYNTEYSATCRQYIPCADARGHSRFEQRKIGPCLSQSLACPCCRCETSGRHHSWWSAPDTERLWSHMHKLSSPRRWEERVNTKKNGQADKKRSWAHGAANILLFIHSQQIYCWLSLKSASRWVPWTLLSSSLSSSSPVSCRHTSSPLLWPGKHTPERNIKISIITIFQIIIIVTV